MVRPSTLSYLRSEALACFEAAANSLLSLNQYIRVGHAGPLPEEMRLNDFILEIKNSKLERRLNHYLGKNATAKFMQRLLATLRAAIKVRLTWRAEEEQWMRTPTDDPTHTKTQLSSFVRTYLTKPIDSISLDANWFCKSFASSDDEEEKDEKELVPVARPGRIDQDRRNAAIKDQTIIMECLPADILEAAYTYAAPTLRSKLVDYSSHLHTLYRSRLCVDQSNVLCHLDQVRGEATQTLPSHLRAFGADVLQLIAKFACNPKDRPLPIRAPRLLDNASIAAALTQVVQNMEPLQMTRDATRACLKRILESIPDSSVRVFPSPPPAPAKKKRRRVPRGMGQWVGNAWVPYPGNQPPAAAAAAAAAAPAPVDLASSDEDVSSSDDEEE